MAMPDNCLLHVTLHILFTLRTVGMQHHSNMRFTSRPPGMLQLLQNSRVRITFISIIRRVVAASNSIEMSRNVFVIFTRSMAVINRT